MFVAAVVFLLAQTPSALTCRQKAMTLQQGNKTPHKLYMHNNKTRIKRK